MKGSLHAQLARDLISAIGAGRYPVGSHLPTELELAGSFGASRNTVRSALLELQGLGLISRKRRAGTRVEANVPMTGFRQSVASIESLMQFGEQHSRSVLAAEPITVGRALARVLGCAAGTRWLHIVSLRRSHGKAEPVGWTDSYLDLAYQDLRAEIEASPNILISSLVEAKHGRRVAEIQQDIDADVVAPEMADALLSRAGTEALRLVRRYVDPAGVVFLITRSLHPAGRLPLSMRLRREAETG